MNCQVHQSWAPRGALSIARWLRHAWWANVGHTDLYSLIAGILCSPWGLLLGRGQTLQALWSFRKSWSVFVGICWNCLERKGWAVFKSIHAYRLQKGTMVVSLGFSMVLLSLSLFTVLMIMVMSVAVCLSRTHGRWLYWTEESTSRYQTHTWRGGMRRRPVQPTHAHYVRVPEGYDGLMLHRGSNDPARGGVATSGSLDDHKSRNRTWWLTWWVSVGRAAAHVEKSVVMKQHVQSCIIPSGNMGSIKYSIPQGLACCWRRWRLWWWGQLVGVLPKQGPSGDKLPGPRSHGLPGRTAQQIPGARSGGRWWKPWKSNSKEQRAYWQHWLTFSWIIVKECYLSVV